MPEINRVLIVACLVAVLTSSVTSVANAQTRFSIDRGGTKSIDPETYPVVDMKRVNDEFTALKNSGLEFHYLQGACHDRSHYLYLMARKDGLPCFKIWSFAPNNFIDLPNQTISVNDPNHLLLNNQKIDWGYHVAPAVNTNEGIYVLDPAMGNQPLPYKAWLSRQNNIFGRYVFLRGDEYSFNSPPPDSVLSSFYKYTGNPETQKWIPQNLALLDVSMRIYNTDYLNQGDSEQKNAVRAFIAYISNVEQYYRENKGISEAMPQLLRDYLNKNGDVLAKHKAFYLERVGYWDKNLTELTK